MIFQNIFSKYFKIFDQKSFQIHIYDFFFSYHWKATYRRSSSIYDIIYGVQIRMLFNDNPTITITLDCTFNVMFGNATIIYKQSKHPGI